MTELAPGIAPVAITGIITNNGTESTFITTVTVRISSVTKDPAATAGPCTDSDYVLLDVAMPVGQTLAPGQSVNFAGARIGFNNKASNQDACRRSVVNLQYVSS